MNTLAFTDSNSISDIKLVDMIMATEYKNLKKEAYNLLDQ